ncbi:MAG: hypothetical protein LRZ85_04585 [Alphaproteobacteria bacterium]|nr:hypothetical protein [Alphaproteobacteria bacterium]MCD8519981.1 hypothetical protein [Alphaproteobacteria bacterium]MCD8571457.1 hypothetical protein [Alphaproteobacteria bacterium]
MSKDSSSLESHVYKTFAARAEASYLQANQQAHDRFEKIPSWHPNRFIADKLFTGYEWLARIGPKLWDKFGPMVNRVVIPGLLGIAAYELLGPAALQSAAMFGATYLVPAAAASWGLYKAAEYGFTQLSQASQNDIQKIWKQTRYNLKRAVLNGLEPLWHYGVRLIKGTLGWLYDPRLPGGYPLLGHDTINKAWNTILRSTLAPITHILLRPVAYGVPFVAKGAHIAALALPPAEQAVVHGAITSTMTTVKFGVIGLALQSKEELLKSDMWRSIFHRIDQHEKEQARTEEASAVVGSPDVASLAAAPAESNLLEKALSPLFNYHRFKPVEWVAGHVVEPILEHIQPHAEEARLQARAYHKDHTKRRENLVKAIMKSWGKESAPEVSI